MPERSQWHFSNWWTTRQHGRRGIVQKDCPESYPVENGRNTKVVDKAHRTVADCEGQRRRAAEPTVERERYSQSGRYRNKLRRSAGLPACSHDANRAMDMHTSCLGGPLPKQDSRVSGLRLRWWSETPVFAPWTWAQTGSTRVCGAWDRGTCYLRVLPRLHQANAKQAWLLFCRLRIMVTRRR